MLVPPMAKTTHLLPWNKELLVGATCFLRKPFEAQTLVNCLQRVLDI